MSNKFRENIRNELNYQGITVKVLSAKTGISIATLDCYLGARATIPFADAAVKIAKFLKVSLEYLVIGENKNLSILSDKPGREAQEIVRWVGSLNQEQCKAVLKLLQSFKSK